jgi:glutamate racemase
VIDTSLIVADYIQQLMKNVGILSNSDQTGDRQFFVSDYTQSFEKATEIFFGKEIKLTQYSIWD